MSNPVWNKIEFVYWERGKLNLSVNEFVDTPIVLSLEGNGYDDTDQDHWMTPVEARELAAKLIEAADASDKAGFK